MDEPAYFVGVKFSGTSKSYYFSTDMDDLKIGDLVVVETVAGFEMGTISTPLMDTATYHNNLALKPIIRKPTQADLDDYAFNQNESQKAIRIAQKQIEALGLEMNLLDANYTLDGTKVTITYTADARVDFRELLKLLAPQLHCRIELRQIAPRDKAKMIGGLGTCGLPLCCSTFLDQFDGISVSRAKNQMLTLNIPKLSGACGKLICCLLFEDDMYTEAKKDFPRLGTIVHMDDGDYTVSGFNILNKQIKLTNAAQVRFLSLEEVKDIMAGIKRPKPKMEDEMASPTFRSDLIAQDISHPEIKENNKGKDNNRRHNDNRQKQRGNKEHQNKEQRMQNQPQQNRQNNNHRHRHHHGNRPNSNQGGKK
ncbi:MAG: stage 0 sporulation protein [Bacilli bacterium]|nr:stage 0 sporulation protein [Bacilli bacterium]